MLQLALLIQIMGLIRRISAQIRPNLKKYAHVNVLRP